MSETPYAIGMRRGGTIWWEDAREFVHIQKHDGPVIIIALEASAVAPEYPVLADMLKTATTAAHLGITYEEAAARRVAKESKTEGWWGSFARVLQDLAIKMRER